MKKIRIPFELQIIVCIVVSIGLAILLATYLVNKDEKRRQMGRVKRYEIVYEIDSKPVTVDVKGYYKNSATTITITSVHIPVAPDPTYVFTREDFMSIKSIRER